MAAIDTAALIIGAGPVGLFAVFELGLRYRDHYLSRSHELLLFEGTLQMLHGLKERNHLLAVATGKARRGLNDALAHSQLHAMFDATRTADETAGKPELKFLDANNDSTLSDEEIAAVVAKKKKKNK